MIEKHHAETIAAAINILRPDWPTKSITTIIGRNLINRPYRDLAIALTIIATDPTSKTPARICEDGPWWHALTLTRPGGADTYQGTPRNHETCPIDGHSGWKHNCGQCRADQLAATQDQTRSEEAPDLDAIDRQVTYRRGIAAVTEALAHKHTQPETTEEQAS